VSHYGEGGGDPSLRLPHAVCIRLGATKQGDRADVVEVAHCRDLLSARWCEPSLSVLDVQVGDNEDATREYLGNARICNDKKAF
jgi:hypothetical protein